MYLKGTVLAGTHFLGTTDSLVGFADASWADDPDSRHSALAHMVFYSGTAITWQCQYYKSICRSSMEVETRALVSLSDDIIWFRRVMQEVGDVPGRTVLFTDNRPTLCNIEKIQCHNRSKHYDVALKALRELAQEGVTQFKWISTQQMIADLLTKPLGRVRFRTLRELGGFTYQKDRPHTMESLRTKSLLSPTMAKQMLVKMWTSRRTFKKQSHN